MQGIPLENFGLLSIKCTKSQMAVGLLLKKGCFLYHEEVCPNTENYVVVIFEKCLVTIIGKRGTGPCFLHPDIKLKARR